MDDLQGHLSPARSISYYCKYLEVESIHGADSRSGLESRPVSGSFYNDAKDRSNRVQSPTVV